MKRLAAFLMVVTLLLTTSCVPGFLKKKMPNHTIEVSCKQDLEYIPVNQTRWWSYSFDQADLDQNKDFSEISYDYPHITDDKYASLQEKIDSIVLPALEEQYRQNRSYYSCHVERADSLIVCLYCEGRYYNIATKEEKVLTIGDIVKDKDAFADLLTRFLENAYQSNTSDEDIQRMEKKRRDQIEQGTLNFQMYYDKISISLDDEEENDCYHIADIDIPAMPYPEIFDMDFFGHTPEYYILKADLNGYLFWDFDNDGILDVMRPKNKTDYLYALANDFQVVPFDADTEVPVPDENYFGCTFIQSDDGRYIYVFSVGLLMTSAAELTDKLRFSDVKKGSQDFYNMYVIDAGENPADMIMATRDILGKTLYQRGTILGGKGSLVPTSQYANDEDDELVSLVDIQGTEVDKNTGDAGTQVTISAGSSFDILEYNEEEKWILFQVTSPSLPDEYLVRVDYEYIPPVDRGEPDGGILDGIDQYEVFDIPTD